MFSWMLRDSLRTGRLPGLFEIISVPLIYNALFIKFLYNNFENK